MSKNASCSIWSLSLALVLQSAFAATEEDGTIVVVATRQPSRASALAADVSVIEREQIEAAGPATTLGDLLSSLPGVELSREGGRGTGEGIFIRGANSGHTLILVDDMRMGSSTLGITSVEMLPLAQIERIEVLRGAASSLYGSEAIGGVIRIFTRQGEDSPRFLASAGTGSRGTNEASVSHNGRVGDFRYAVRAGEVSSRGVNTITNPSSPAYNPDKDGYWRRYMSLDTRWKPDALTEIGLGWLENTGQSRYDSSWPNATADYRTHQSLSKIALHGNRKINDFWTTEIRFGRGEDDSFTKPSATVGQVKDAFRTRQDQLVWQNDLRLPLGRGLLALESLHEEVDSTNVYTNTRRETDSLVLGWNGSKEAHFWQSGLRRDENSQFGGKTTYNINYGYRFIPGWSMNGGIGSAYKAPTFNDLYFPYTVFVGGGNPNLVPESSKNKELAIRYAGAQSEFSATIFRNDIRSLIQWEEKPIGSFEYFPTNIGTARITGLTLAAGTKIEDWQLRGHVTAQSPKNLDTGEYLVRRARHHGNLAAQRDYGAWSFATDVKVSGKRYDAPDFTTRKNTKTLGGYAIVNARTEYRLDNEWKIFGRIDNVFDKNYALARASTSEYVSLSRTLFFGMQYALK